MRAVTGFLWRLENASFPVRVAELQIGTRKEGADDLSLQLRISALCRAEETTAPDTVRAEPAENKSEEDE